MKNWICMVICVIMLLSLCACGAQPKAPATPEPVKEWTRAGYFADENENMLSVTWMDDIDEPGWYVGVMLGEDFIEDSWGGTLQQEGNTLRGKLPSSGSKSDLAVTISEEGEDGLLLSVEGGESYHFSSMGDMTAGIMVTINTEGRGMIGYEEGETVPELDPEWPYQSAQVNLGEPETYTFAAAPEAGNVFVKWTKNGEDFSAEPVITVLLDESADFVAVFEEDADWQNPVMNFVGEYQSGRAHALVECSGNEDAWMTIEWGGSAWELARWDIFGRLDTETLTLAYSGVTKSIVAYDDSGEIVSQEPEYEDGTGTITFHDDGTFTWHEDQSEYGTDMVFEWLPVNRDAQDTLRYMGGLYVNGNPENDMELAVFRNEQDEVLFVIYELGTYEYGTYTTEDAETEDGRAYTKIMVDDEKAYGYSFSENLTEGILVSADGKVYNALALDESAARDLAGAMITGE